MTGNNSVLLILIGIFAVLMLSIPVAGTTVPTTSHTTMVFTTTAQLHANPVVAFSADITDGSAPLTVQFTDMSTGGPVSWSWDFGDGTSDTSQAPSHTYSTAGTYTVRMTATTRTGSASATREDYIMVDSAGTITKGSGLASRSNYIVVEPASVTATTTTTKVPNQPPAGLPPSSVVVFLFIALIPLILLLVHDYLGLGHLSFSQPLNIRVGVAIGYVACGAGLLFVLKSMIDLSSASNNQFYFPFLIVLLLEAYLIFSALALAIGSLLSRPLRWTMKVHVVIGVIILLVMLISLFLLRPNDIILFLVAIVAALVSALLALWQDYTLVLQLHLHK